MVIGNINFYKAVSFLAYKPLYGPCTAKVQFQHVIIATLKGIDQITLQSLIPFQAITKATLSGINDVEATSLVNIHVVIITISILPKDSLLNKKGLEGRSSLPGLGEVTA